MENDKAKSYAEKELFAFYELGRMYYELGYFAAAERIFSGLAAIDGGATPAKVGLGLIKLETGLIDDAVTYFREGLEVEPYKVIAKIGLAAAFIANNELPRARSVLGQVERDFQTDQTISPAVVKLCSALAIKTAGA